MSRPRYAVLAMLLVLALAAVPVLAQQPAGDIAGEWTASVFGQIVTASFTHQGDMIYGVVVIPDIGGGSNTYHLAGVIVNGMFAAQHGSGHLLKGNMLGPNEAQAVFTPKSGPPLNLTLRRRPAP